MENSGRRGQLSAPGRLESGAVVVPEAPRIPDQPLRELAAEHDLKLSGARPALGEYLAMLWQRRHFIIGYATARNVSMYTEAKLGQLWQVLTPLLNAGVYYLIFGVLFEASRGVQHYPAFLLAGVFVFAFTERSIVTGSNVMRANLQLIRALYFPRASLPLAYVIVELQQMLVGFVVLIPVMLVSGEPLTVYWFLLIPAVLLQTAFNIGAALIVARLGGSLADVSELIPFILRITRYFCGVMYMVTTLPAAVPTWGIKLLSLNPPAVYISLVRVALMQTYRQNSPGNQPYSAAYCSLFHKDTGGSSVVLGGKYVPLPTGTKVVDGYTVIGHHQVVPNAVLQAYCHPVVTNNDLWIAGVGWGIGFLVLGIIFFWQAESKYGRG
ncbi:MAG TPA: ABC transporter permease [Streptosporangiaceae bacterium]|nr:ABC transporter permease [Streptosporangiaceae bacterium]